MENALLFGAPDPEILRCSIDPLLHCSAWMIHERPGAFMHDPG
jgi:hypothetical protein